MNYNTKFTVYHIQGYKSRPKLQTFCEMKFVFLISLCNAENVHGKYAGATQSTTDVTKTTATTTTMPKPVRAGFEIETEKNWKFRWKTDSGGIGTE